MKPNREFFRNTAAIAGAILTLALIASPSHQLRKNASFTGITNQISISINGTSVCLSNTFSGSASVSGSGSIYANNIVVTSSGGQTNTGASGFTFYFTGAPTGALTIIGTHDTVYVDNGEGTNPRTNIYYYLPGTNYFTVISAQWTSNCFTEGSISLSNIVFDPTVKIVCWSNNLTANSGLIITTGTVQWVDANNCLSSWTTNNNVPVAITSWWTVAVPGSFSTNGSGLGASFNPVGAGQGTISFFCAYSNPPPCTNIYSVTNPIGVSDTFMVFKIDSVTNTALSRNPANVVAKGESVTFTALCSPSALLPECIIWSGALSGSGVSVSGTFNDAGTNEVVVTCGGLSITNQIIVIEISGLQYLEGTNWLDISFATFKTPATVKTWTLKAIPTLTNVGFPETWPRWTYPVIGGNFTRTDPICPVTFYLASICSTDTRHIIATCGSSVQSAEFLVYDYGLAICARTNTDSSTTLTAGHAFIAVRDLNTTIINRYGAWNESDPGISQEDHVPNTYAVLINYNQDNAYESIRYYLLTPSERSSLSSYIYSPYTWTASYYNCAYFAVGATPNDVNASDTFLGFTTPRALAASINEQEASEHTCWTCPHFMYPHCPDCN